MEKQNVKEVEGLKNSSVATESVQGDSYNKLFVTRRVIPNAKSQSGRPIYDYYLESELRGVRFKVNFEPKDVKGYTVLDIIYALSDFAELEVTETKMPDSKDTYFKLAVIDIDEDGEKLEAELKCSETSDKNLFKMVYNKMRAKANR